MDQYPYANNHRMTRKLAHLWSDWRYKANFIVCFLKGWQRTIYYELVSHTYLIGHKYPINKYQPAATHPSGRLCFLRAYTSWSHQSMAGFHRFDRLIPASNTLLTWASSSIRTTWPLDINTLHNVHVVEEHIQLTIISDEEIIAKIIERHGRVNAAAGY